MPPTAVASFLDAIRDIDLLPPTQLDELSRQNPRFAETRVLAQHLLQRGWLTPYQVNQLVLGRGPDLVLGPYLLIERLGEGSSGQVFKARHRRMKRTVALKVVRKELLANADAVQRFYQEIQAASQLDHPNVVHAFDAGPAGPTHFLAMEYIEGIDLSRMMEQTGPLPEGQAGAYIAQAALGLQHAFERGLVHRDIKPSNLFVAGTVRGQCPKASEANGGKDQPARSDSFFLTPDPSSLTPDLYCWGVVKILDFGLARVHHFADHDARRARTSSGAVNYMAPEQSQNSAAVDIRADIYSLGATFCYLLTGQPPAAGNPLPPTSPEIQAILHRMLAASPADRYQSPIELAEALAAVLGMPLTAPTPAAPTVSEVVEDAPEVPTLFNNATGGSSPAPRRASASTVKRLLIAGGVVAILIGAAAGLYALLPRSEGNVGQPTTPASALDGRLEALIARTKSPPSDPMELWQGFANLAMESPASPEGQAARSWLSRLPSPLDRINPQRIPTQDRYPAWQPRDKELVAVLGEHAWRHWSPPVRSVAVSPNGQFAASGDGLGIYLWEMSSGRMLHWLKGHGQAVHSVVFAPDSTTLVSGSADKTVKLWQVSNGQLLHTFGGIGDQVHCVAFAPDGQSIAAGSQDKTVRVWDVLTKKDRMTGREHKNSVHAVAFAPDSQTVASGSLDGTIKLWDVAAKKSRQSLAHKGGVQALAFDAKGDLLASGSNDHSAKVFDARSGEERKLLKKHTGPVMALAFSPDGTTLVTGGHDRQVLLWDPIAGKERATAIKANGSVRSLAFTSTGQSLLVATDYSAMRLWEISSGTPAPVQGHTHQIKAVAFSPDARTLATGGQAGSVKLWDMANGTVAFTLSTGAGPVDGVAFSPDGTTVASVGRQDKLVRLWEPATGKTKGALKGHTEGPVAVAFSPDGRTLATGGADKTVRLWDLETGKDKSILTGAQDLVTSVAFSPDGRLLAWGSQDKTVRIWDVPANQPGIVFKGHSQAVRGVAFAPDGLTIASIGDDRTARIWDPLGGKERPSLDLFAGNLLALAYTGDSQTLVVAGADGRIVVWKLASRTKREWQLPGAVFAVAVAADGRHIATGNANSTAYVIRLATHTN
ncbi:MAG: serine/threonine protein kinase [Gemmataceae bacterium]|nr:serine/threonine protein kinase [Gemmataceae bacterium]